MPKPSQTYLYLNRQQRIHHRAASSNQRYNVARVTAHRAFQPSEALFEEALSELLLQDVQTLHRQTLDLANRQDQGYPLPDVLLQSWVNSETLQQTIKVMSHATRCGKSIFDELQDRKTLGQVRALFMHADKLAAVEETFAKLSHEMPLDSNPATPAGPNSYAGQLQLFALATFLAILISLLVERQRRGP